MENVDFMMPKFDFARLSSGIPALKLGKTGSPHILKIQLSSDEKAIEWRSKTMGLKFGKKNRGILRFLFCSRHEKCPDSLFFLHFFTSPFNIYFGGLDVFLVQSS